VDAYFTVNGRPAIDALVSLTGFSLVGGPAYNGRLSRPAAKAGTTQRPLASRAAMTPS
jgi:magnesium chelatase subunit H